MAVEGFTAWPSRYAMPNPEPENDLPDLLPPTGTVLLRLQIRGYVKKRQLADQISGALHEHSHYDRKYDYYSWKNMALSCNTIYCGPIPISGFSQLEPLFMVLEDYTPDDIVVTYFSAQRDLHLLANLVNILESRMLLLQQALALDEEPQIILNDGFALGISLGAFSYTKIEAVAYLMAQACEFAASTGKARMKPADGSNPKFQMRSWLLRLGFIGPGFERPRKTLLEALDGDSAFFSEEQKKAQVARRKAKYMNTYA